MLQYVDQVMVAVPDLAAQQNTQRAGQSTENRWCWSVQFSRVATDRTMHGCLGSHPPPEQSSEYRLICSPVADDDLPRCRLLPGCPRLTDRSASKSRVPAIRQPAKRPAPRSNRAAGEGRVEVQQQWSSSTAIQSQPSIAAEQWQRSSVVSARVLAYLPEAAPWQNRQALNGTVRPADSIGCRSVATATCA